MPLTRIDSAFLDLEAIGGIDFDVQDSVPTLKVEATNHRVGIGHNSPAYKLDVVGDVNISSGSNYLVAGSQISTANVAENASYLYYTDTRARSSISITDSGGDGSLSYDNSTGVITYTGPSATDVREHFSAGSGISITSGSIAIVDSVGLTGTPTAPTATAGTNTTQIATTAFVSTGLANLVDSAPGALDTLNELAAALGDDASFSTTITNSIATKLPLAGGQMTGDITFSGSQTVDGRDLSVDGSKLDGIETGATANQTAAEILTAIKTVDGSGSGLDADTLDGYHQTSFIRISTNSSSATNAKFAIGEASSRNFIQSHSSQPLDINPLGNVVTIGGSSNTVWHAGNDGSGSGLDADLLDGIQGSNFLRSNADDTFTGQLRLDKQATINTTTPGTTATYGLHFGGQSTNDSATGITFSAGNAAAGNANAGIYVQGSGNYGTKMYIATTDSYAIGSKTAISIGNNGLVNFVRTTPTSGGNTIWHAGNDGAGSGLDADTLDGIQASSFLRSDATDTSSATYTFTNTSTTIKLDCSGQAGAGNYNYFLRAKNDTGSKAVHFVNGSTRSADGGPNVYTIRNDGGSLRLGKSGHSTLLVGSGDLTYNANKVWHAGNDGSGSGLDADLLDGIQSVDIAKYNDYAAYDTVLEDSGFISYYNLSTGNRPDTNSNYWTGIQSVLYNDKKYGWQLVGQSRNSYTEDLYVRKINNNTYGSWSRIWTAASDGAGSGLDADNLDGYTWASSGKNVRATEFYADNWFRNYNAGEGLHNEATGCHFASDGTDQWTVRDGGNSIRIEFKTNGATRRASVYADNTPSIGFLNSGNQWGLRYLSNDGNSPNLYFREEANETWTGNPGSDMGKIEYHSNRFYVAAGSNSTYVCQFRRGGTDVARVENDGKIYAQGSNLVWHAGNDGSGSGLDADLLDGVNSGSFLRSDAADTATGTLTVRDIKFTAGYHLQRSDHHSGHLEGSYNNIGANTTNSNPIYTIGSSYNPASTTLGNMYGIGYTNGSASFLSGTGFSGWGMYVAADGDARIFLSGQNGTVASTGQHYVGSNVVWNAGNDGSGSGLDADTLDGVQGSSFLRSDAGDSSSQRISFQANATNNWDTIATSNGSQGSIEVYNTGAGNDAFMTFHTGGDFALYFGLDADNNSLSVGGWSMGSNKYKIWHAGNDGSGSGLDADLLDGISSGSFLRSDANDTFTKVLESSGTASGYRFGGRSFSWNSSMQTPTANVPHIMQNTWSGWDPIMGIKTQNGFWQFGAYTNDTVHLGYMAGAFGQHTINGFDNSLAITPTTMTFNGSTIWHGGNDGAGSGLDADLLDGVNSGSFLRSDTSDTFTGTLTMGTQFALVADNYGRGVFGKYSSTKYQHVWSMGTAYKSSDNGSGYGNMYGLTYTHTNVGTGTNESIAGLSHQLQHRINGTLKVAIGSGIWTAGNVTAYSDIAVKRNLVKIPDALNKVCSINGYTYERIDYVKDPEDANAPDVLRQAGVVAQEIEKVLPEVVSGSEGNKAVAYGNVVALLIEAIKEQQEQIVELRQEIKNLKGDK